MQVKGRRQITPSKPTNARSTGVLTHKKKRHFFCHVVIFAAKKPLKANIPAFFLTSTVPLFKLPFKISGMILKRRKRCLRTRALWSDNSKGWAHVPAFLWPAWGKINVVWPAWGKFIKMTRERPHSPSIRKGYIFFYMTRKGYHFKPPI